jgi:HlyD family secretion protein
MEVPFSDKISDKKTSRLPWSIGLAITAAVVGITIASYRIVNSPSAVVEMQKLTVQVKSENLTAEIKSSGTVKPFKSVNISPKQAGRIRKLLVEQGMSVKKGQRLAIMNSDEIEAEWISAQAKLKQSEASRQQTVTDIQAGILQAKTLVQQAQSRYNEAIARNPNQIEQAQSKENQAIAQVKSAEARLKLARYRYEQNVALEKEGAISKDRLAEVITELSDAQANLLQYQANYTEAKQNVEQQKETNDPQILELKAAVDEAVLSLQQQETTAKSRVLQLDMAIQVAKSDIKSLEAQINESTIITAPFEGIITQRYAVEGAIVTPTTSASSTASATSSSIVALATKVNKVDVTVPEIDISQIKQGQKVTIVADAYPDEVFEGVVAIIAPEAVVENGVTSFVVQIAIQTGQDKLRSGMNVDVNFVGKQLSNAITVPTVAIVTENGKQGVLIYDEATDKPKFQKVTIGMSINNKTQILEGLKENDRVFIDVPEEYQREQEKKQPPR